MSPNSPETKAKHMRADDTECEDSIDLPVSFDKEAAERAKAERMAAYKKEHPNAVEDPSEAYEMAMASKRSEEVAADFMRDAQTNLDETGDVRYPYRQSYTPDGKPLVSNRVGRNPLEFASEFYEDADMKAAQASQDYRARQQRIQKQQAQIDQVRKTRRYNPNLGDIIADLFH